MKNILIPTDFSEYANNAVDYGISIAKKSKATIHFLHIISTPVEWTRLPKEKEKNYPDTLRAIGHAKLELNRLEIKATKANLKVKQYLVYDKTSDEIIEHLKHYKHDFIVMGSHGAKGWRELYIGNNAQKVVRNSPVPVLIVREKPKRLAIKKIIFASNFSREVDRPFISIMNFAIATRAHVHLLYVNVPSYFEETDESLHRMEMFTRKCKKCLCTTHIRNALNEERGIMNFRKEIDADMIALSTHGKAGAIRILSHSVAEMLANHSDVPVLSVNVKIGLK